MEDMTTVAAADSQPPGLTRPTAIEVCCGSAGLSASLRKAGIQIFAVDHKANRHATKVKPLVLDLTEHKDQKLFKQLCHETKPDYIHMGLPCGTCSRARERPLPKHLSHMKPPKPLRSQDQLMGLDNLNAYDRIKVEKPNELYRFAIWILHFCFQHAVIVSLENPVRSWLWQILAKLVQEYNNAAFSEWYSKLEATNFAACQHGGSRHKRTKLLATPHTFTVLEAECTGGHKHASWQPFLANNIGLSFQRPKKPNIRHCCVTGWLNAWWSNYISWGKRGQLKHRCKHFSKDKWVFKLSRRPSLSLNIRILYTWTNNAYKMIISSSLLLSLRGAIPLSSKLRGKEHRSNTEF